jgi:uncharacterized membrane protein YgcG
MYSDAIRHGRTFAAQRMRWQPLRAGLAGGAIALALVWSVALPALAAGGFGQPTPGRYIYDHAGALSAAAITSLEQQAAKVVQAGAPIIVYIQAQDATYNQTLQDAGDLMDAWNVQSSYGAHDGVVIFINLTPGDLHHGQVALYAGQAQLDSHLPQAELQRIYQAVMLPDLRNQQMAAALSDAMTAILADLTQAQPPATSGSASNGAAGQPAGSIDAATFFFGRGPLALLALLLGVGALVAVAWVWQMRPHEAAAPARHTPPADLPPGIAGALVQGRVTDAQMEATILDLSRRGALRLDTRHGQTMSLHLLSASLVHEGYEQELWQVLTTVAGKEATITSDQLYQVRAGWGMAKEALRADLQKRGWFETEMDARRRLFAIAGLILGMVLLFGGISSLSMGTGYGLVEWGVLIAAIWACFWIAASLPELTHEGAQVAAPWHGYMQGIYQDAQRHAGSDVVQASVIFAVAFGASNVMEELFHAASTQGTMPRWISPSMASDQSMPGTWWAYHRAFYTPPPTFYNSPGGGGFGGGGAAAGGGGGGGSF